jgi:hypothetical protein
MSLDYRKGFRRRGKDEARTPGGKKNSEKFAELSEGAGIDQVFRPEPTLARDGDPEIEKMKVAGLMSIRVKAAENTEIAGTVPPAPVEIEAPRVAV